MSWYTVRVRDESGAVYLDVRTPSAALTNALQLAVTVADNYARALRPGGPAILVEVRLAG